MVPATRPIVPYDYDSWNGIKLVYGNTYAATGVFTVHIPGTNWQERERQSEARKVQLLFEAVGRAREAAKAKPAPPRPPRCAPRPPIAWPTQMQAFRCKSRSTKPSKRPT